MTTTITLLTKDNVDDGVGPVGPVGPQGPKGDIGNTGATGPAGTTTWAGLTDKPATIAAGVTKADARTAIDAEPIIAAGTVSQYWRGDKTWRDLGTDVRAAVLTGISFVSGVAVTATDTVLAAIGKLQKQHTDHAAATNNPHAVTKAQVGLGSADDTPDVNKPVSGPQQLALDGKADLVAGKVPASQLPGFVDDVEEYANLAALPATGEAGKMYTALDSNKIYRWSGTVYIEISGSPGSTDAVVEGATNLYFTEGRVRSTLLTGLSTAVNAVIAAGDSFLSALGKLQRQHTDHASATTNPHAVTKEQVGLGNAENTADIDKVVSLATQTQLNAKVSKTGDTLSGPLNFAPIVTAQGSLGDVLDLAVPLSNTITVTSLSGFISSLGTLPSGCRRRLLLTGGIGLVHNATSFILPGAANIVTVNGDVMEVVSLGAGNWRCTSYMRANGAPVIATAYGTSLLTAADRAALLALARASDQPTYRNLFVNGDMRLNQQAVGTTNVHGAFPVDQWQLINIGGSRLVGSAVVASSFPGFAIALQAQVSVPGAVVAGDVFGLQQTVEGTMMSHLKWGAADPIGIWLSGFVRSSIAGTYGLTLRNSVADRSYVAPLVINAANTPEYKSFFVPGDAAGTWTTGFSAGLSVMVGLGIGSTYQTGTPNTWLAGNFAGLTGQTQLTPTNGANFQMTGWQCEAAFLTPFEKLPFDVALRRACRYWQTSYSYGNPVGTNDISNAMRSIAIDANWTVACAPFPVPMRTSPGVTLYHSSAGTVSTIRDTAAGTAIGLGNGMSASDRAMYACGAAGALTQGRMYDFHYVADARM